MFLQFLKPGKKILFGLSNNLTRICIDFLFLLSGKPGNETPKKKKK